MEHWEIALDQVQRIPIGSWVQDGSGEVGILAGYEDSLSHIESPLVDRDVLVWMLWPHEPSVMEIIEKGNVGIEFNGTHKHSVGELTLLKVPYEES